MKQKELNRAIIRGGVGWGVVGGARGLANPFPLNNFACKKIFLLSYVKSFKVYIMDGEWIISTAFIITQIKTLQTTPCI